MMQLKELLKPWHEHLDALEVIKGLACDSRQVQPGFLFLAYPGVQNDGRLFIDDAIQAGAIAVVYDPENAVVTAEAIQVKAYPIAHLAQQIALLASRFYHYPTRALKVIGVTGTNGKTTISYQLTQAYRALKKPCAYIGTLGFDAVGCMEILTNTTPSPLVLQELLARCVTQHIQYINMEVSSHALVQKRVEAIDFEQAIFTNLTLDHLDYHQTMAHYAKAKSLLFKMPTLKWAIINEDDKYASLMKDQLQPHVRCLTYGFSKQSQLRAVSYTMDLAGTSLKMTQALKTFNVRLKTIGEFNIYNTLAITASLIASGFSVEQILPVLETLNAAPGRMEIVHHQPYVIVDFAHTPDALENVLKTLVALKEGQVIVVFGCGGGRDKTKRALMGQIAATYADKIIITSDNPRFDDPQSIIEDIKTGIPATCAIQTFVSRQKAIEYALKVAQKNDTVLIAGKGHEAYQIIGTTRYDFSDQAVVKAALKTAQPH